VAWNVSLGEVELLEVSSVGQDYLKAVWTAAEWSATPVTVSELAQRMGVSPSSASEAVSRLASQGLLAHERYAGVELTEMGTRVALGMVRRHRLIESFLVEALGYTWDEVDDEAEILEHAVSDTLVARIDAFLGHPQEDPHGDPIPADDGTIAPTDHVGLIEMPEGASCAIARIRDADPEVLRFLAEHEIGIGRAVQIVKRVEVADLLVVRVVDTSAEVHLGSRIARLIRVRRPAAG
jgi:DtxR family Mn-dependent transcriptional regulator